MEHKDRFVDELLDSALAHHRRTEPRPGLEARILKHVRAAIGEDAGGQVWKLWLAAAATAAAVVVFVAIHVANRPQKQAAQPSQASKSVPAPLPGKSLTANSGTAPEAAAATTVVEPRRTARRERNSPRRIEAHHWPSQFPSPAPLSPEEKALVRYVQETPPQVLAQPILKPESAVQRVEVEPLEIAPLEIKPLAPATGPEEMP